MKRSAQLGAGAESLGSDKLPRSSGVLSQTDLRFFASNPNSSGGLISLWVALCLLNLSAAAQSNYAAAYTFTTFAGVASTGNADGVGTAAQFNYPDGVAADTNGNLYVADTLNHTIRRISSGGVVSTIAGFAGDPGSADGTGRNARFYSPSGVALDNAGDLYVADTGNSTIRKVIQTGTNLTVVTIAGLAGFTGTNDGPGSVARLNQPRAWWLVPPARFMWATRATSPFARLQTEW